MQFPPSAWHKRNVAARGRRRGGRGFTIVELLVVIVVLAILMALLLPAVNSVRMSARRMVCRSNLRQIGIAMMNYLEAHGKNARFPYAAQLPSVTPEKPTLVEVLGPWIEDSKAIFRCPEDSKYFEEEGISYEYTSRIQGDEWKKVRERRSFTRTWVLFDYEDFHGGKAQVGSRNALYADGHVDSY